MGPIGGLLPVKVIPFSPTADITLINGKGSTVLTLPSGSYSLIAIYQGDDNYTTVISSPLTQVVIWLHVFLPFLMR
jgi:hypothetical protein